MDLFLPVVFDCYTDPDIICYTTIIGVWIYCLWVLHWYWKQYRKLSMVIQWSIADLRVNRNMKLLKKHVIKKRFFDRIFKILCIGVLLIFSSYIVQALKGTVQIILRPNANIMLIFSFCQFETSNYSIPDLTVIRILYWSETFLAVTGCFLFFVPYIGYGLKTMFVTLWRLFRGKSGFRTHFPNPTLQVPLVQPTKRNVFCMCKRSCEDTA